MAEIVSSSDDTTSTNDPDLQSPTTTEPTAPNADPAESETAPDTVNDVDANDRLDLAPTETFIPNGNTSVPAANQLDVGGISQTSNESADGAKPDSHIEDRTFHYPTELDPMRRLPSTTTYLDRVQREEAEIQRARLEDREPDLVNPPAAQSTPLYQDNQLGTLTVPEGVEGVTLAVDVAGHATQSPI